MHDLLANQLAETREDLTHYLENLILFEFLSFHELLEITILAKLGDYVQTIFRAEYILELHYVGVVEPLQKVNLRKYCILQVLVISESRQVDLLYRHLLLTLTLDTLVNLTVYPLPQAL